jgi:lipopolysaccharide/colanic/teichoic acid biosynthesis glycosyltransferase
MNTRAQQAADMTPTFYTHFGKRFLDVVLSFAGLVVLSPFLLVVAAAAKLSSRGPALFRQIRAGRFEKPFHILKFRTMRQSASGPLVTAANDSRITPLGRLLRKTKIDELPQLFNVLVGDMSLVGPRPEVPFYTAKYSEVQREVFSARPGITRPDIAMDEEALMAGQTDPDAFYISTILPAKLELDLAYCRNVRFGQDLRILFVTLWRLALQLGHIFGLAPAHSEAPLGKVSDSSQPQTLP